MSTVPDDAARTGGPATRPALRRCVAIDPQEFADAHWSRRPLLSTATDLAGAGPADAGPAAAGFGDLLDLDAVDDLLSRRGLRTPFIRVAKDGRVLDTARYTGSGGAGAGIADQVRDESVLGLFADGATVVLQALHRTWPPVVAFASTLAGELGHPVQVNAYVTPPQSQGFSAHYDVHDVFVLQIAGTKRWVIHPPVLTEPLRTQPWTDHRAEVAAAAAGPAALDTVLAPGDALYLPRGWLHAASAQGEVSCHLTVGVHNLTRWSVVEAVLAQAAADPALRHSLPLGVDPAEPGALDAEIGATLERLAAYLPGIDRTAVAAQVRRQLWSAVRPAPLRPLAQAVAAADVTQQTIVVLRPQLRLVVEERSTGVRVVTADRRIDFPGAEGAAVQRALDGTPAGLDELPGLEPAQAVALVARLLREGLVVPRPG